MDAYHIERELSDSVLKGSECNNVNRRPIPFGINFIYIEKSVKSYWYRYLCFNQVSWTIIRDPFFLRKTKTIQKKVNIEVFL